MDISCYDDEAVFCTCKLEQKITASLLCAPRDNKPVFVSVSACHVIIHWEAFINEDTPSFFLKDYLTSHLRIFLDVFTTGYPSVCMPER